MTTLHEPDLTDETPTDEVQRLRTELRRAELRVTDLRAQLELRLQTIREMSIDSATQAASAALAESVAQAELDAIRATKLFRLTRGLRHVYGRVRSRHKGPSATSSATGG